jgi:sugar-specific transcriptional regulator TrmB
METKFLKEIGLTDNEIRIYLEILKGGLQVM